MNLSKRKEELQKEFDELQDSRKNVLEQAKQLQQQLTAIDDKIKRTQGAFIEITNLEKEDNKDSKEKSDK